MDSLHPSSCTHQIPALPCCPARHAAGLLGAWAVHYRGSGGVEGEADGEGSIPGYHRYLLLSFQGGTKVLATGEELQEVTET